MAKGKSEASPRKKAQQSVLNPCGVCSADCYIDVVLCDACDTWYHTPCLGLDEENVGVLKSLPKGFLCAACRATPDGNFDFTASLARLNISSHMMWDDFMNAAILEEVMINSHEAPLADRPVEPITIELPGLSVDKGSMELLSKFGGLRGYCPVLIEGDGDALFRSISIAMYGTDSLTQELRVRCCIEMIQNQPFYETLHSNDDLGAISPEFRQSCQDCCTAQGASSAWTLHAVSSVIQTPVLSVYPTVNGLMDKCVSILNNKFLPREGNPTTKQSVSILWTRFGDEECLEGCWVPNHFVPLVPESTANVKELTSLVRITPQPSHDDSGDLGPEEEEMEQEPQEEFNLMPDTQFSTVEADPDDQDVPVLPPQEIKKESTSRVIKNIPVKKVKATPTRSRATPERTQSTPRTRPMEPAMHATPLQTGFLATDQLLKILNTPESGLEFIPKGLKEDVYFVINNTRNLQRRSMGQRSVFSDDCGSYSTQSSSTKTTIFSYDAGKMSYVVKRDGKYGKFHKKTFVELSPQPVESELIVMKRYYGTLKRQPGFRKRVTWFENLPLSDYCSMSMLKAVVEYTGSFPDNVSIHGNAKTRNIEYTQSPIANLDYDSQNIIAQLKPKAALAKLMAEGKDVRDIRQIQNKRYNIKKKAKLMPRSEETEFQEAAPVIHHDIKAESMGEETQEMAGPVTNIVIDASQEMELANNGQIVLETVQSNGEPATYYIIQTDTTAIEQGTVEQANIEHTTMQHTTIEHTAVERVEQVEHVEA